MTGEDFSKNILDENLYLITDSSNIIEPSSIVDRIIKQSTGFYDISGSIDDPDQYCGAAMEIDEWKTALKTALKLSNYCISVIPKSQLLYIFALKSCSQFIGTIELREKCIQALTASGIKKENWSADLYDALCEHYYFALIENEVENSENEFKTGIECSKKLQKLKKYAENGYYWEIEFYLLAGQRDRARIRLEEICERCLDPNEDVKFRLYCPYCYEIYITEFLKFEETPERLDLVCQRAIDTLRVITDEKEKERLKSFFSYFLLSDREKNKLNRNWTIKENNTIQLQSSENSAQSMSYIFSPSNKIKKVKVHIASSTREHI